MKSVLILFSLLLLISCNKEKLKITDENSFIVGDYEWVYSYGENNESESFETFNDRYAIRIKKNGKAEIWKNEEKIDKGYVSFLHDSYGTWYVNFKFEGGNRSMIFDNNTLEVQSYPIIDHTNFFQKQ